MTQPVSTALITGVTGQDGVHLARLLKAEGMRVVGTHRPNSGASTRMAPYLHGVKVLPLDLRDATGFIDLVNDIQPAEVYNLAAQSSVGSSWSDPEATLELNGAAPTAMLNAVARVPGARFLQAASSEESGAASGSPYARGKAQAHEAVVQARKRGQFASAAVLHIHESPLRRPNFVVRKISRAAAAIALGRQDRLELGSLDVRRDWGDAADYVRALRLIIAADEPADFEVATGAVHELRHVVEVAFAAAGVADPWSRIDTDESLLRPRDATVLVGDPEPIRQALGWVPRYKFSDTIERMVAVDRLRIVSGVEERESYLEIDKPGSRGD